MDIGLAIVARVLPNRPRPLAEVYAQIIDGSKQIGACARHRY